MSIDQVNYDQEELKATEKADKTTEELGEERVNAQTEQEFRKLQPFFNPEKKVFQPGLENSENPGLAERVARLEKNQAEIRNQLEQGLSLSIASNPKLLESPEIQMALKGSVNFNPGAVDKEISFA